MNTPIQHFSQPEHLGQAYGPYSMATRAGRTLYFSGRIARPSLWEGTVTQQTNAIMSEFQLGLGAIDPALDLGNVAMTNVYLTPEADFGEFNTAYGKFFPDGKFPARTCVRAEAPVDGPDVEISAVAVMGWAAWARVALREKGMWPAIKKVS